MSYNGYRIKIAGNIIYNNMIVPESYSFAKKSRVLDQYYDASGILHEEKSNRKTVEINFSIIERSPEEHAQIMLALTKRDNVTVEYWDDENAKYSTGTFKIEDLKITHKNSRFGALRYAEMPIQLKEY